MKTKAPEELLLVRNLLFFSAIEKCTSGSKVQDSGHQWVSLLGGNWIQLMFMLAWSILNLQMYLPKQMSWDSAVFSALKFPGKFLNSLQNNWRTKPLKIIYMTTHLSFSIWLVFMSINNVFYVNQWSPHSSCLFFVCLFWESSTSIGFFVCNFHNFRFLPPCPWALHKRRKE